jgi:hypothetical protein
LPMVIVRFLPVVARGGVAGAVAGLTAGLVAGSGAVACGAGCTDAGGGVGGVVAGCELHPAPSNTALTVIIPMYIACFIK